jgi:hypothetical protein
VLLVACSPAATDADVVAVAAKLAPAVMRPVRELAGSLLTRRYDVIDEQRNARTQGHHLLGNPKPLGVR